MPDTLPAYGPRACRELRGFDLKTLSAITGFTPSYLNSLEQDYLKRAKGDTRKLLAPYATARRITEALDLPLDCFYVFPKGTAQSNQLRTQNAAPLEAKPLVESPSVPRRRISRKSPAALPCSKETVNG